MAEQDPPPAGDPPPDPQAVIADLQAKIEAATGSAQRAFQATKDALTAANPGLPATVFEAPDLETLLANVEAHKATAAHVLANAPAATPPPGSPPPAGGLPSVANPAPVRQAPTAPAGVIGIDRIKFGLAQRS